MDGSAHSMDAAICVCVCVCMCVCVCVFLCLSVCLSVCLSLSLSVCVCASLCSVELKQRDLETIVPKSSSARIMCVRGRHKGRTGHILQVIVCVCGGGEGGRAGMVLCLEVVLSGRSFSPPSISPPLSPHLNRLSPQRSTFTLLHSLNCCLCPEGEEPAAGCGAAG